jgi:uncharacterized membrane protein (DUF2068 family)
VAQLRNVGARPDAERTAGIRLIILYKAVKGALEALGAAVLAAGPALGLDHVLVRAALDLSRHSTRAWAINVSRELPALLTPGHLRLAAVALVLDAALTLVEGWALQAGKWWGPWLVVVASGALLPFEVVQLARGVHVGRVIVLLVNALIVGYLVRREVTRSAGRR